MKRPKDLPGIIDTFTKLGLPGNEDKCFAITRKWFVDNFQGKPSDAMRWLPRPDYEHRIYWDDLTDNMIVARPDAYEAFKTFKRLR